MNSTITNSFKFYQEVIDIHHCVSLRRTPRWLDLHIPWNGHNRFRRHPSSHIDIIQRKEGRKEKLGGVFCVMRALRIYSLKQHPYASFSRVGHSHLVHYITSTYLSWYLWTPFFQFHTAYPSPTLHLQVWSQLIWVCLLLFYSTYK